MFKVSFDSPLGKQFVKKYFKRVIYLKNSNRLLEVEELLSPWLLAQTPTPLQVRDVASRNILEGLREKVSRGKSAVAETHSLLQYIWNPALFPLSVIQRLIIIINIGDERSTRGLGLSYLLHPSKKYSIQELCFCALESKSTATKQPKH